MSGTTLASRGLLTLLLMALVLALAGAPARAADPAPWTPVSGLPLTEPQQVHSRDGVLRVTLDARLETISVSNSPIVAQPFNHSLVGPTLHVRPGDTIEVTFVNATPQDTNIHFHGMHVSPRADGDNVFRTFAPGSTNRTIVRVPKGHSPGTYWYHAHLHAITEPQLMGGLSGLIVVEGLERLLPRRLRGIPQRQIAIRDLQADPDNPGEAALSSAEIDTTAATTRLVNGLLTPRTTMRAGETQLWRLANIGTDLFYQVQLEGHRFRVIAEDGSPVWRVRTARTLLLPPGKRYDVLVEAGRPGSYRFRTLPYPEEGFQKLPEAELMTVDVRRGRARRPPRIPRRLATPAGPITRLPVARKRTFTFSFGTGATFTALINGQQFDPTKTNVAPIVGTVEEWTLRNEATEEHPFHIHINAFQVMSVNGRPYRARGLQDVVTIPRKRNGKAGEVVIRIPFRHYTGHFVFHCHILGHEDAGMMMTVQVRRKGEPVTPPPTGLMVQHALHSQPASAVASDLDVAAGQARPALDSPVVAGGGGAPPASAEGAVPATAWLCRLRAHTAA